MTRKPQLSLETLEAKNLLSPGPSIPFGISQGANGILRIKGAATDDAGHVTIEGGQVHAVLQHKHYTGVETPPYVWKTDADLVFPIAQVHSIAFYGGDGDDEFNNDSAYKSSASGGNGNDFLQGGSADDLLIGGADDDTLQGCAGNDDLRGWAGDDVYLLAPVGSARGTTLGTDTIREDPNVNADTLDFSALTGVNVSLASTAPQVVKNEYLTLILTNGLGIENVRGTPGADAIYGNNRPNEVLAFAGDDTVHGAGGNDILYGGEGNDSLRGGAGHDVLTGAAGNDLLYSGTGINTLSDGPGNDRIDFHWNSLAVTYGTGGGNDTIIGSAYADKLTGSAGNDRLEGSVGNDSLYGGAGNDTLLGQWGKNTLSDGTGNDTVDFSLNAVDVSYTTGGGNDTVVGSAHNDVLTGSSGNDQLFGGAGNDRMFGLGGTDQVYGDNGNDWLDAGSAGEIVIGGNNTDYNARQWAVNGATYGDVKQAGIGSCVFLSALSGGAMQGIDLAGRISYQENYIYNVQLFDGDGDPYVQPVYFDGSLVLVGGERADTYSAVEGEFWTILYQRAYLTMADAQEVNFHDPDYALRAVTGQSVDSANPGVPWVTPASVAAALAVGKVVIAYNADDTEQVYAHHSYTVMDVYQLNGTWTVKLRNPWGKDVSEADLAAGTHVATGPNSDGIIVMTWDDFVGYNDFDGISFS